MSNCMIYDVQPVLTSVAKLIVQEVNKNCSWIINNSENYPYSSYTNDELEDEFKKLNSTFLQWKKLTDKFFNENVFDIDNLNSLEQLYEQIIEKLDFLSRYIFNIYDLTFLESSWPEPDLFAYNKTNLFSPNNWKFSDELRHLIFCLTYLKSLPDIFEELIMTLFN
ncbi:hypothetical protein [Mycoplasma mycoides]|uniref:hypothetical protein n=1 Tax=Mycoplasma mycoides TaxID=2102 RepID=UPI00223F1A11|nr:hypothetical protein [Mycoplasma mycoides]